MPSDQEAMVIASKRMIKAQGIRSSSPHYPNIKHPHVDK